jgi:hypothetical protein
MCKDDIKFDIKCLVLVEKPWLLSRYLTRWIYDARILYVVARTRRDFSSYRLGLVEDLQFIVFQR